MPELEARLQKLGIDVLYKYKGQTQEKQGISFKMGNVSFKGSQIDREYSLIGLQKIIAGQQKVSAEQKIPQSSNSGRLSKTPGRPLKYFRASERASSAQNPSDDTIGSGMSMIMQILLQPGLGGGGTGRQNDLTPEERRKRKKKKRPNL